MSWNWRQRRQNANLTPEIALSGFRAWWSKYLFKLNFPCCPSLLPDQVKKWNEEWGSLGIIFNMATKVFEIQDLNCFLKVLLIVDQT